MNIMRWLTIESFMEWHPRWRARLLLVPAGDTARQYGREKQDWYDQGVPGFESMDAMLERARKIGCEVTWCKGHGNPLETADMLKWQVGGLGLVCDLDILYLGPFEPWLEQFEAQGVDIATTWGPERPYASMGMIYGSGSPKAVETWMRVAQQASERVGGTDYSGTNAHALHALWPRGPDLMQRVEEESGARVGDFPFDTLYPWDSTQIKQLWQAQEIPPAAVGVHWYAGHPDSAHVRQRGRHDLKGGAVLRHAGLLCRERGLV